LNSEWYAQSCRDAWSERTTAKRLFLRDEMVKCERGLGLHERR
jgi:hypothetical protein